MLPLLEGRLLCVTSASRLQRVLWFVRKEGHVLLFLRTDETRGLISRLLNAVRIDVDDAVS